MFKKKKKDAGLLHFLKTTSVRVELQIQNSVVSKEGKSLSFPHFLFEYSVVETKMCLLGIIQVSSPGGDFVLCLQISLWWRWVMPSDSHPCFTTSEWERASAWPTTSSSTVITTQTLCSLWRYLTCLLSIYLGHQGPRDTSLSLWKAMEAAYICESLFLPVQ